MVETRSQHYQRVSNIVGELTRQDRHRNMRRIEPQLICPAWQRLQPDDFHDGGRTQLYEAIIRNCQRHQSFSVEFAEEPDCDNALLVVVKKLE